MNTAGLGLSNPVCPECGLVHPQVAFGECPIANEKKIKEKNIKTHKSTTHNREENVKLTNIKNMFSTLINVELKKLVFENEYSEDKFYKNLENIVIGKLKEFLNEYKT